MSVSPDSATARFGGDVHPRLGGEVLGERLPLGERDAIVEGEPQPRDVSGCGDVWVQCENGHDEMVTDSAAGVKSPTDKSVDGSRGPC